MTSAACPQPLPLSDLIDYLRGDLDPAAEDRVETHFFACRACTGRLDGVRRLGDALATLVRSGRVVANATEAVIERARFDGLAVRQYRLVPGQRVACTVAPRDDFVAVRLAGDYGDADDLRIEVDTEDLSRGARAARTIADVVVDQASREIVLLFPGEVVRAYPRSVWTLQVTGARDGVETTIGRYVMDHTPWEQLAG